MENSPTSQTQKKKNPVMLLALAGLFAIILGILILFAGKGIELFSKLDMSSPQPTNTMIQAPIQVSDNLKKEGILGELKSFEINSSNFKFTPAEIVVNSGDTVQINFTNSQGMHNFTIKDLGIQTQTVQTGGTQQVTFIADKKGIYTFTCTVGNHETMGMTGTLIIN